MNKKILVVDDEPMLREILKDFLELGSYQVDQAHNGHEAFKMINQVAYDCVISDVRMPNGDGTELAKNIFNMQGVKPIVFLATGFSDISAAQAKALGVEKVLHKPFDYNELLSAVRQAI